MKETTHNLVLPCLLLDWRDSTPEDVDSGGRGCDHVCEYKLLLPIVTHDIRQTDGLPFTEIKMGSTFSTGPSPRTQSSGELSTPYRDGVHAMRDSVALRVPLYVRYRGDCQIVHLHPTDYARYAKDYPRHFPLGVDAQKAQREALGAEANNA